MNRNLLITIIFYVALIWICNQPWVHIDSINKSLTGFDTEGTRHGKPAYLHIIFSSLLLIFTIIPKLWAKRINVLFGALNFAWAIKNFMALTKCEAGECPQKLWGIFALMIVSLVLLLTTFFPKIDISKN